MKRKKRSRFTKMVMLIIFVLIPGSALAIFGMGDSGDVLLTAMLAEMKIHTSVLDFMFEGVDYLDQHMEDMRLGVGDAINLDVYSLVNRNSYIGDLVMNDEVDRVLGYFQTDDYKVFAETMQEIWGPYAENPVGDMFRFKDYIPLYSLGQTPMIVDHSKSFHDAGVTLFDDLDNTTEGKATIRSAQADALQVQQLAQIETNQATQISLHSQQVLGENEVKKGLYDFSRRYNRSLINSMDPIDPSGSDWFSAYVEKQKNRGDVKR